jgi:hypothetical protein
MADKWDKAYSVVNENFGWTGVPRHLNEADPYPQQGQPQQQQQQAPPQQDMGDMNQEQPQQGDQQQRSDGQWDDDIKSQVNDMAGKSLKDLYAGLEDDQAKTDFVKNVAGPGIKAQLGIDNIPYKELHGILGSAGGEEEDQGGEEQQFDDQEDQGGEEQQQAPEQGQQQQLQQSRY